MRLYKLVGLEMGKLLDELAEKQREAKKNHQGPLRQRIESGRSWTSELAEIAEKSGDDRRTALVEEQEAAAIEYNPDEFVEHEDTTVILSSQGWIRRIKMEVEDPGSLKFREGDGLFGLVRVNTEKPVAYSLPIWERSTSSGPWMFPRPPALVSHWEASSISLMESISSGSLRRNRPCRLNLAAGRTRWGRWRRGPSVQSDDEEHQQSLFQRLRRTSSPAGDLSVRPRYSAKPLPDTGVLITRNGKGFRFEYNVLTEITKRSGRRMVNLGKGDQVVTVKPVDGDLVAVASKEGQGAPFRPGTGADSFGTPRRASV